MVDFLTLVCAATVAKLVSSGDDVVWFMPFVTGKSQWRKLMNVFLYVGTLEIVVLLSALLAWGGTSLIEAAISGFSLGWSSEKTLRFIAGFGLTGYALHLFLHRNDTNDKTSGQGVVVVSFLGSLDELSYFPGLILGGTFTAIQLAIGTAVAGLIVAGICLGATRLKLVVKLVEKIPLWLIIGAIATWTLLETTL